MHRTNKLRLLEFFIIGVFFGTIEDMIAISLATDSMFEWNHLFIAIAVAAPFAFISEIVVDHPSFWKNILPKQHKDSKRIK